LWKNYVHGWKEKIEGCKKFVVISERGDFWWTSYPSFLNGGKSLGVTCNLPQCPGASIYRGRSHSMAGLRVVEP
jgi:hypothetical protein